MTLLPYVEKIASPRISVVFFIATALGALLIAKTDNSPTLVMVVPFSLLVLNLAAAILSKPRFRADLPLLLFHLALLTLVALFVCARLVYFKGGVSLTEGTAFEGRFITESKGPLHPDTLDSLRFQNEGFSNASSNSSYDNITYNRVRWWDKAGNSYVSEIGDNRPLILDGYRIYASYFRGLSPVFSWKPTAGMAHSGTVQLNRSGDNSFAPAAQWQLPQGPEVWVMLNLDQEEQQIKQIGGNIDPQALAHHLVIRAQHALGPIRGTLKPGQSIQLDGGVLTYDRLSSWMGYQMVYEPMTPWLVATVALGVFALLWFYSRILFRPIDRTERLDD